MYESTCLLSLSGEKFMCWIVLLLNENYASSFPLVFMSRATAVSGGKVLLAELSEEAQQALLPDPLPVCTPRSVAREALLEQLKTIKSGGVADDHDEYIEGLCSYSVLLDTYLGHYSVSIVAPNSRATTRVAEFQQALQACKQNIEVTIGRAPREFAG